MKKPMVLLSVVIVAGIVGGYTVLRPRPEPYAIAANLLLLDESVLPDAWIPNPCTPDCAEREGSVNASRTFVRREIAGVVIQDAFVFPTIGAAQRTFNTYRKVEFYRGQAKEFLPPPEVTLPATHADEAYFGCGEELSSVCRFIVRYRNIFIRVYIDHDRGTGTGLTFDQIQVLLDGFEQHTRTTLGM